MRPKSESRPRETDPARPESRNRYARLKAAGKLTQAGINRAPTGRGYDFYPSAPSKVPQYILDALKRQPTARRHFEKLAPSQRRNYVGWVDSAKRADTKARRLSEAIRLLAAGRQLGLK